jgi:hypothetical protein
LGCTLLCILQQSYRFSHLFIHLYLGSAPGNKSHRRIWAEATSALCPQIILLRFDSPQQSFVVEGIKFLIAERLTSFYGMWVNCRGWGCTTGGGLGKAVLTVSEHPCFDLIGFLLCGLPSVAAQVLQQNGKGMEMRLKLDRPNAGEPAA